MMKLIENQNINKQFFINNKQIQIIMKKYLTLAAIAALTLAACSKVETTSVNDDELVPIGFGAYAGRSLSKASSDSYIAEGSTFSATNQHIGVYAFSGTSTTADFMNDVDVTLAGNGATASDNYSPLKYWPKDETVDANKLSFFAYYPYNGTGISRTNLCTSRYGSIVFTAQAAAADQVDLMVSDAVENQYYSTNSGVVPFVFHHALTRVLFYFNVDADYHAAGTDIVVTGVTVSNINTVGTLTLASTYAGSNWGSQGTPESFSPAYPNTYLTTTAAPTEAAANVFLMVPQTLSNSAKLTVTYTTEDLATHVVKNGTAEVQLNTIEKAAGVAVAEWTKNMNIAYTITLSLKPIKFTATVNPWESLTSAGVTL